MLVFILFCLLSGFSGEIHSQFAMFNEWSGRYPVKNASALVDWLFSPLPHCLTSEHHHFRSEFLLSLWMLSLWTSRLMNMSPDSPTSHSPPHCSLNDLSPYLKPLLDSDTYHLKSRSCVIYKVPPNPDLTYLQGIWFMLSVSTVITLLYILRSHLFTHLSVGLFICLQKNQYYFYFFVTRL
jgi:hypothetical protein